MTIKQGLGLLDYYTKHAFHDSQVPTVNQETAEVGAEPTKTLMKFPSDKKLCPNDEKHQGRVRKLRMIFN